MKPERQQQNAASQAQARPDAGFSLLRALNEQLVVADELQLDLVAIRISEAIDQLMDELGLQGGDGAAH
jgi:hypothetical protein